MDSIFKKLVRREFGQENYARYCRYILYEVEQRATLQNPMIYEDMYRYLEGKDRQVLLFMKSKLEEAMLQAFVICKGYTAKLSAALGAMLFVLLLNPPGSATLFLLSAICLGLMLKTYEYVTNKYCYVDARLVLIYKNVLDRLCPDGNQKET